MALLGSILDSPRLWRWGFILLIALPALVLATLGIRAVRAEKIERREQLRARQAQAAQLADSAVRNALVELGAGLRAGTPVSGRGIHPFTIDRPFELTFPSDRLRLGGPSQIEWPEQIETLIEEARTAELQERRESAAAAYRRIAATEPRLRSWAALAELRLLKNDDLPLLQKIADDEVTPTGLPLALVTAARIESLTPSEREHYRDFVEQTRTKLRSGTWWLSYDERRYHDRLLGRLLGDNTTDRVLPERAAAAQIITRLPLLPDQTTQTFERTAAGSMLVVVTNSARAPDRWNGAVLDEAALRDLIGGAAGRSARPDEAHVADAQRRILWGAPFAIASAQFPMPAVPGWTLVFRQPSPGGADRRTMLWIALVAVVIVMLLTTIAVTVHVAQREAELARMQNDFIAGVSHDFKSPITGARLLIERIASGRVSPESLEQYRDAAERELARLERHVNRLLEAQQIQAGRRRYEFAPASLSEIVDEAVEEQSGFAEAKGLRIAWDGRNGLPPLVVDREAMRAAVGNLLANAIKYSPSGARIEVRTRVAGDRAFIEVADEGTGIDEHDHRLIFRRFQRGKNTLNVSGTGLGLALVRATVEAHHGEIAVSSSPGKGSRFTISLPTNVDA